MKKFTTNEGLPSSQVYDVIEDDFGFLWFSTDKGLARYNGYEFENFSTEDGLPDNVVFDFLKKKDGKIWCSTNSTKLFSIQGRAPSFEEFKCNDTINKYAGNLITKGLYFDANNSVFISFHNTLGYLMISKNGTLAENFEGSIADKSKGFRVNVLVDDDSEPFFFNTSNANSKVNNRIPIKSHFVESNVFKSEAIHYENKSISVFLTNIGIVLKGKNSQSIITQKKEIISSGKLDENHFWIGLRYGGVKVYSINGELKKELFPDASVTQLYKDKQNNIWVTTLEDGVFCIGNSIIKYLKSTKGNAVSSISPGNANEIYVGFYNGNIDLVDERGIQTRFYTPKRNRPATIFYHQPTRSHFFGSDILFSSDKSLRLPWNCSAIEIFKGNYLIAGYNGLRSVNLSNLNISSNVLFKGKRIKDALELNDKIYAATLEGIFVVNNLKSTVSYIQLLKNVRVDDLAALGSNLVVGTYGNGIKIIDKHHKVTHSINSKNGLSSNFVSNIFIENDSTLWIATNKGLNRIIIRNGKKYSIKIYTTSDGLLSNEIWSVLINRSIVWIGTQNGLCYFSKNDVEKTNGNNQQYHLQWSSLKEGDTKIENKYVFAYNQNNFEFSFLAIRLGGGKELMYRYKLKGLSKKWKTTRNRTISFPSLPYGRYELIIQVRGKDEKWNQKSLKYAFLISPPFWTKWWFILICSLGTIGLIYLFFRIKILVYNKDIVREILRYALRKIRRNAPTVIIKHNGKTFQLKTEEIHYFKTSGNYIEIKTTGRNFLVRSSVSDFMNKLPDAIEFIQVHRSYIIRLDKIQQIGPSTITVLNEEIPIGRKFNKSVKLINMAVDIEYEKGGKTTKRQESM